MDSNEVYKLLRVLYYGAIIILVAHTFESVRNLVKILDTPLLGNLTPVQAIAIWVAIGTIMAYNRKLG